MITLADVEGKQNQLFHLIHEDDIRLLESKENEWFKGLYYFQWEQYRGYAAKYYDALYEFNLEAAEQRNRIKKVSDKMHGAFVYRNTNPPRFSEDLPLIPLSLSPNTFTILVWKIKAIFLPFFDV